MQKEQMVKVLRAFRHKSDTVGKDSTLKLPLDKAIELRTANKVEFVAADTKSEVNHEPTKPVVAKQPPTPTSGPAPSAAPKVASAK